MFSVVFEIATTVILISLAIISVLGAMSVAKEVYEQFKRGNK